MANHKYRQVFSKIWKGDFFDALDPSEKLFWLYLLTNEDTTQCGIYYFRSKHHTGVLGFSTDTIDSLRKRFEEKYKKIAYDNETHELAILNWGRYNYTKSPKIVTCITKELEEVKSYKLVRLMQERTRVQEVKKVLLARQKSILAKERQEKGEKPLEEPLIGLQPTEPLNNQQDTKEYREEREKERERERKEKDFQSDQIFLLKNEIEKFLDKAFPRKQWLEMIEGLDCTVPEMIEKIVDGWVGEDRPFKRGSKPLEKGVRTFAIRWCENERDKIKDNGEQEEGIGNNPDKVIEIYKGCVREVSDKTKQFYIPIIKQLMKKGELNVPQFQEFYPKLIKKIPKARELNYLFDHYPRLYKTYGAA